jgi:NifU-like protein involved in Fe-S cluster formation
MENLMNEAVVDILSNPENWQEEEEDHDDDKMSAMMGTDRSCDLCGDYPCVWIVQRAAVVANDERTRTQYRKQD